MGEWPLEDGLWAVEEGGSWAEEETKKCYPCQTSSPKSFFVFFNEINIRKKKLKQASPWEKNYENFSTGLLQVSSGRI